MSFVKKTNVFRTLRRYATTPEYEIYDHFVVQDDLQEVLRTFVLKTIAFQIVAEIMKNHLSSVLVGFLAFGVGVFFTFSFVSLNTEKEFNAKRLYLTSINNCNQNCPKSGNIEFVFKGFSQHDTYKRAEFILINRTDKDIYYLGHNLGQYCTVDYRQKGITKTSPACCGTGLDKRTLEPGKAQIFTVFLFDWKDVNQVGFKLIDENKRNRMIWSDKF